MYNECNYENMLCNFISNVNFVFHVEKNPTHTHIVTYIKVYRFSFLNNNVEFLLKYRVTKSDPQKYKTKPEIDPNTKKIAVNLPRN